MKTIQTVKQYPEMIFSFMRDKVKDITYKSYFNKGYLRLPYPPINVRIEPTNKCNLQCIMCPHGSGHIKNVKYGFMDFSVYKNLINQITSFSSPSKVLLYLGGEPLLHQDIYRMIRFSKKKDLATHITTNATLLTDNNIDKIFDSGLDNIEFSFDDVSPIEYETMRRKSSYYKTLNNILSFLKRQKELHLKKPRVFISSVRLRKNNIEKRMSLSPSNSFRKIFSNYNVDINCFYAHLWAGDFYKNPLYKYKRKTNLNYIRCNMPWKDMTINWEGMVVACCYDLNYDYIIGDAKVQDLIQLWNNNKMMKLRFNIINGHYDKIKLCRFCSYIYEETERNVGKHYKISKEDSD